MLVDSLLGMIASLGLVVATNAVFVGDWPRFFMSLITCILTGAWLLRRILLKSRQADRVPLAKAEVTP